jgi:hypothetical protein
LGAQVLNEFAAARNEPFHRRAPERRCGTPPVTIASLQERLFPQMAYGIGTRTVTPNNSFKPKTNRCAIVFGLIQVLDRFTQQGEL